MTDEPDEIKSFLKLFLISLKSWKKG